MNKKTGSYVGITGFMTLAEVVHCNRAFCRAKDGTDWMLKKSDGLRFMVGVLASSKTLAGGTNKYPNRYPPINRVPEIFSLDDEHLLRTIHYNTDDAGTIDEQVDELMKLAPGDIDAIQLNIRWVNPVKLVCIKRVYRDLRIILQIGAGALDEVTESEDIYIGSALRPYADIVNDFLVDPGGGRGDPTSLDIWKAFACLSDHQIPPFMHAGVAGGRDADNVRELKGLMRRYSPLINLDAEGRLRTPRMGDEGDHLDLDEAVRFLTASVQLVNEVYCESAKPNVSVAA